MATRTRKSVELYERSSKFKIEMNHAAGYASVFFGTTEIMRWNATEIINLVAQAFANAALKVMDTGGNHEISIVPSGNEVADRVLSIPLLGADDVLMTLGLAQTVTGIKTFGAMPRIPVNTAVAAAGSVQGDAAALSEGFTRVTGANGTVGVRLPAGAPGAMVIIKGGTSGVLKVWPASGGQINAVGADTAMSLASGLIPAIFIAETATQWWSLPLVPS